MKKPSRLLFLLLVTVFSCSEDETESRYNKELIIGTWDSYEMGSSATGFTPGIENLITTVYASGFTFYENDSFSFRNYDHTSGLWTDGNFAGTYKLLNEQTLELTFSPDSPDEQVMEIRIDKLNKDFLWIQHDYWISETNTNPTEHHLKKKLTRWSGTNQ